MIPNNYILEQLNIQHRQQALQAAEHKHLLSRSDSPKPVSRRLPRLAGKLGIALLKLGTTLKEFEQHNQAVVSPGKYR